MATLRISGTFTPSENELGLTINNGDLKALREAVERLGFKDEVSALRFVLAVLAQSATRSITITNQNGVKISLNPSESLLQQDDRTQAEVSPA